MVGIWSLSRRLLAYLACTAVLVSCSATSATPHSTPAPALTPAYGMVLIDGYQVPITAIQDLGVTGTAPEVDIGTYRLTIDGLVGRPLVLGYDDISGYPMVSKAAILVCPEAFTDVAEWTGVPVSTLLEEAHVEPQATQVSFCAIDGYQRTFPLAEVMRDGALLALMVNGQILPKEHGYPLRLVMAGKEGNACIKWVNHIELKRPEPAF
jgi:DMSO/TMAO reductase YedYZ molybdopterin-dependent catalytic subunit